MSNLKSIGEISNSTTELCDVAFGGNLEKVKSLIRSMTLQEINGKNARGQTALYCAARNGHLNIVLELVRIKGIDLDAQEPRGSTALHAASFGCHGKVVSILLHCGAQTDLQKNPIGNTRGLMAREEAQGESREVWKLYMEGGLKALEKAGYIDKDNSVPPRQGSKQAVRTGTSQSILTIKPKKTKTKLEQILPQCRLKEGQFFIKSDSNSWKEMGVILFEVFGTYRIATYKIDEKEPLIKSEMVLPKIENEDSDPPFGITTVNPESDTRNYFFIRGVYVNSNANDPKETIFRAANTEVREDWLSFLYKTCMPKQTSKIKHPRESLTSPKDKEDYLKQWREYEKKGLFAAEVGNKTQQTDNDISALIKEIEIITEDDIYYNAMQKLISFSRRMPRGDPLRETLVSITRQPRPHDMDIVTNSSGESQVSRFRAELNQLEIAKSTPTNIKKVIRKLDKIYASYINSKGAIPRPALLRSGVAKIGSRIVPQKMADRILDPNANTAEGVHRVVRVGNVFFKVNPTAPAYEMAVGELSRLIWRQATAQALIVKIELGDTAVVCQAAAAVDGLLLRDFIAELPDLIKYLDYENFTVQYLAATLYRPLDGKLDNLIVRCENHSSDHNLKKLMLVCIDSDECFADEFIMTSSKNHEVSVRFSVWLLPQSTHSQYTGIMNANACKMLLRHSPEYFVINLLIYLFRQNEKLNTLFDEGVITKLELLGDKSGDHTPLIALFRPKDTIRLFEDIRKAQEIIHDNTESCLFNLFFKRMYPIMSKMYEFIASQINPDMSNFQHIIEKELFGFGRPLLEKYNELTEKWVTLSEDLKVYTKSSFAYVSERSKRPEEELEALIEHIDFSKVQESEQAEILWELVKLPLKNVTIRNSQIFSKKHLEDLLGHQVLSSLTLEGCPKINNAAIHMLEVKCEQFSTRHEVKVRLINCPNIRRVPNNVNSRVKITLDNTQKYAVELNNLTRLGENIANSKVIPPTIKDSFCKLVQSSSTGTSDEFSSLVNQILSELENIPLSRDAILSLENAIIVNDIPLEAIENGNVHLIHLVNKILGYKFPQESLEGESLLQTAIDFAQDNIALYLIENTKSIRYCNWEILHQAITSKMISTAAAIIYSDPSYLLNVDSKGNDVLMLVSSINDSEVNTIPLVDLIMKLNPDIHNADVNGNSPLHIATSTANIMLLTKLVDEGFNIDAKFNNNFTPLEIAIKDQNINVIEFLIKKRCKITMDHLKLAAELSQSHILDVLVDALEKKKQDASRMKDLLGSTILHFVKHRSVAEYILRKYSNLLSAQDVSGSTPLMKLTDRLGNEDHEQTKDVISYLITLKADINTFNLQGFIPLHTVLIQKKQNLLSVVSSLLELKADPTILPKKTNPPLPFSDFNTLHMAIQTINKQVVTLIINNLQTMDKDQVQKLYMQEVPSRNTTNIYEFSLLYKNVEIVTACKSLVSLSIIKKEIKTITVYFTEGGKKTIPVKQPQLTLAEFLGPICKQRGKEVSDYICKDKGNKKLKMELKLENIIGGKEHSELYLKKKK